MTVITKPRILLYFDPLSDSSLLEVLLTSVLLYILTLRWEARIACMGEKDMSQQGRTKHLEDSGLDKKIIQ